MKSNQQKETKCSLLWNAVKPIIRTHIFQSSPIFFFHWESSYNLAFTGSYFPKDELLFTHPIPKWVRMWWFIPKKLKWWNWKIISQLVIFLLLTYTAENLCWGKKGVKSKSWASGSPLRMTEFKAVIFKLQLSKFHWNFLMPLSWQG